MQAVTVSQYGGPDVLEVSEVPDPQPGPGQVRVRVTAAAVNPVDTFHRAGYLREVFPQLTLPTTLGWDVAGVVDAVGPQVTAWRPGDRVLGMSYHFATGAGTQAGLVVLDEFALAALPGGLDDAVASSLPLAGLTAVQSLDLLDLGGGQRVLVTGALGSVGGFAVQLAARRGRVVVASVSPADADGARALGAAEVVHRDGDVAAQVRARFPGGVDGVLDAAASGTAIGAVRDGGAYVAVTDPSLPSAERGVGVRKVDVRADGRQLADLAGLLASGRLDPREVTALPLTEVAEAHRRMEKGGIRGKLVLVP